VTARYYLLRLQRGGPLVPARLQEIDHELGVPDNLRDRWPPTTIVVDIAGEVVPPEELTERFFWKSGHWKFAQPITKHEYTYRLNHLRWAEANDPAHPALRPRRRIDPRTARLPLFGGGS
jgi:hypothetical protein